MLTSFHNTTQGPCLPHENHNHHMLPLWAIFENNSLADIEEQYGTIKLVSDPDTKAIASG